MYILDPLFFAISSLSCGQDMDRLKRNNSIQLIRKEVKKKTSAEFDDKNPVYRNEVARLYELDMSVI